MTVFEKLSTGMSKLDIPFSYSNFTESNMPDKLPYAVYLGSGADTLTADNIVYWSKNLYIVEYYFDSKNERKEKQLEDTFTEQGFIWQKSADVQIPEENIYVIYYDLKEN